jgi:pimeloyl-ACP methyl ester carboxylesterase
MTVVIDGVELHWREAGAGDAIVFLHPGPGTEGAMFLPWVQPLAQTHRVILLDLPDHGRSGDSPPGARSLSGYARAVAGFADALELGEYTLLGHSFGSFVALTHAIEHPGHAVRVVSSCGGASEDVFDGFEERLAAFGRPEVTRAFEDEDDVATEEELRAAWKGQMPFFCADPDGPACQALVERLDDVRFRVEVFRDSDAFGPFDMRAALADVAVPVLAIGGAEDRATPPDGAREVARCARDGRVVVIERAGHFPYAEQPEAYLEALGDFLRVRA